MKESSGNGSTNSAIENNISSGGSSPHSACATLPAGSSSNTALVHRHINSNSNHASVKGGAFQTSLDDIDDVIVESPVGDGGGNFLTVNNFAPGSSVINCSEDDHLFVGGSSSGGQNGAVGGGESSRSSSSSGGSGQSSNASKSTVRLVLGVIVLVIVDVIWVASSELSFVSDGEIFFISTLLRTLTKAWF